VAGEMTDDVWILPALGAGRPSSRNGSLRAGSLGRAARHSSPGGSWRSQDGGMRGRRPRGRDVFGTPEVQEEVDERMMDESTQTTSQQFLVPPPPPSRGESMSDIDTPRRKRPGYFSAREEDLDPLEMDLDDFIVPARKRQRTSVSLHQGPKFAALWDPSRRENWPLGHTDEVIAKKVAEEMEQREREKMERVRDELKDLESPAFKLPPSARKDKGAVVDLMDQESPTKNSLGGEMQFEFGKKKDREEELQLPKPVGSQTMKAMENGSNALIFDFSKPPTSPKKVTEDSKPQFPTTSPVFRPGPSASTTEDPPSKTSTFMQSILGDASPKKSTEDSMEDIPVAPPRENGMKSPASTQSQSQSSPPKFAFSVPSSQSTFGGGMSQESTNGISDKLAVDGGFKFGSFGAKEATTPPKEMVKVTSETVVQPHFNFGMPKPAGGTKESEKPEVEEKPVQTKPSAPTFKFGSSGTDAPTIPVFGAKVSSEPKKEAATPAFGAFGSAFNAKPDSDKPAPLFGAPSSSSTTNGTIKEPAPVSAAPAPTFGSTVSSGFKFGKPAAVIEPSKKELTPPPAAPTSASQDLDDSMDITDSPPASRNPSFAGLRSDVPSHFPAFPASAPTSAPSPAPVADPPKLSFNFGTSQVNGTTEKPTISGFQFNAPSAGSVVAPVVEEKKTGFGIPTFGGPSTAAPVFGSPAPSPAPGGFSAFGNAFGKKDGIPEIAAETKPAEKLFTFGSNTPVPAFGSNAPTPNPSEQKPFGGQTTTVAPTFGNTSGIFGATSSFPSNNPPQPSLTSPPLPITSPAAAGGFSFNFNAPTTTNPPSFASGGSTFSFTPTAPISNPFSSNPIPSVTSPPVTGFPGINSAPVSPQNQQLPSFPTIQSPFGGGQQQPFGASPGAPIGGGAAANFQFGQGIPQSPIFTLGSSQMQRSSSDAGPSNLSPSARRFAQPRRRRNPPR
jgi:hypothetical protein